jgi:FlaA1/EpsC-like NDP-sugar epimerase
MISLPKQFFLRLSRKASLFIGYSLIFSVSLLLAFEFRDSFRISEATLRIITESLYWVVCIKLLSLTCFRQFRGLLSYFRLPDVYRLAAAMAIPSGMFLAASFFWNYGLLESKSAILLDFFLSLSLLCIFRTSLRIFRERREGYAPLGTNTEKQLVAIYGAGETGSALVAHLMAKRGRPLKPVLFLDDDENKWNKQIHGFAVMPPSIGFERIKSKRIAKLVVAMPSASSSKLREIAEKAERIGVAIEIVPSWEELVSGKKRVDKLRPVRIEDLLGRNAINLHSSNVFALLTGKVVLVTGAGGTIGGELCLQIAQCEPSMLILVERAEFLLFQIEQTIRSEFPDIPAHAFIGDVTDPVRMDFLIGGFLPHIIFHAAAHKHVPMMEHQPGEAIRNNTFGTLNLADLAIKHEVERFVLISSDKAVNPTNVMGVTKRLAEIAVQALQERSDRTQFMAVRFGNVLGSSGSVIPTFRKQIENGGPVTVTHPDITRYFMTVAEAVGLVLDCSSDAKGGEIFVLDMGKPMKVFDLAKKMIALSGLKAGEDIEIKFTGLRPGEKLYEELQHDQETLEITHHEKVFRFTGHTSKEKEVRRFLKELAPLLRTSDYNSLKRKVKTFVPEYVPDFSVPTWAYQHGDVATAYRKDAVPVEGENVVAFDQRIRPGSHTLCKARGSC